MLLFHPARIRRAGTRAVRISGGLGACPSLLAALVGRGVARPRLAAGVECHVARVYAVTRADAVLRGGRATHAGPEPVDALLIGSTDAAAMPWLTELDRRTFRGCDTACGGPGLVKIPTILVWPPMRVGLFGARSKRPEEVRVRLPHQRPGERRVMHAVRMGLADRAGRACRQRRHSNLPRVVNHLVGVYDIGKLREEMVALFPEVGIIPPSAEASALGRFRGGVPNQEWASVRLTQRIDDSLGRMKVPYTTRVVGDGVEVEERARAFRVLRTDAVPRTGTLAPSTGHPALPEDPREAAERHRHGDVAHAVGRRCTCILSRITWMRADALARRSADAGR